MDSAGNTRDCFGCLSVMYRGFPMKTRIKEFRARHDMTQEELARRVGVRRETIVFLERGKYNPSLLLAHRIAKTLKATIEELFIFEDKK